VALSATFLHPFTLAAVRGKRDVTVDELMDRAVANSCKRGAHKASNEIHGRAKHIEETKKDPDRTLGRSDAASYKKVDFRHPAHTD
jgi:hypothetical protein